MFITRLISVLSVVKMLFTENFCVGAIDNMRQKIFCEYNNSKALVYIKDNVAAIKVDGLNGVSSSNVEALNVVAFYLFVAILIQDEELMVNYQKLSQNNNWENTDSFNAFAKSLFKKAKPIFVDIIEEPFIVQVVENMNDLFGKTKHFNCIAPANKVKVPKINFGKMSEWEKQCIPVIGEDIYVSDTVDRIALSVANGAKSTFFYGGAGLGKSTAVDIICSKIGLPVKAVVNCTSDLDHTILGKWIPEKNSFTFKRSMVTEAIENGGAVVFEELNFANPKYTSFLFSILDDYQRVILDDGSEIKVNPNFRFFATLNPSYAGTNHMNKALMRRFNVGMFFEEMSEEQLKKLISAYVPQKIASGMIQVYNKIREKIISEEREEIITPRYLKNWAKASQYTDIISAAQYTILGCAVADTEFRQLIEDMVDATFEDNIHGKLENVPIKKMTGFTEEQLALVPKKDKSIYKRHADAAIMKMIADGTATSMIIYGGTGTGKSTMEQCICDDIGCPIVEVINCTSALDHFVLGKWIPVKDGFEFKKSKVTEAIENGGAVLFEEINFGDPRFMSFFHSLMDHRKFVELDDGSIVKVHPNFRLFATMNPGYEGTNTLNKALYDRFELKLFVDDLSIDSIKTFVQEQYKISNHDFSIMSATYSVVKEKILLEERDEVISPDIIKNWAREINNGFSLYEAAELTILNISLYDMEFRHWISNIINNLIQNG